ncbi:MAG: hypothetical protein U0V74_17020 [Chitinophagales bacterium]
MHKAAALFFVVTLCSFTYRSQFSDEYTEAVSFLSKNNNTITSICNKYTTDVVLLKSIVFPELTRYSLFKDFFESSGNEVLYVNGGRTACDFSIGNFQMKPSFAEDVEQLISISAEKEKFSTLTTYKATDDKGIRRERVERLKQTGWQTTYLCAFIALTSNKVPQGISREEQIRFYAAAYNLGLKKSTADVITWQGVQAFPYGKGRSKFAYADVALEYYNTLKPL